MKDTDPPHQRPQKGNRLVCIGNGKLKFFDHLLPKERINSQHQNIQPVKEQNSTLKSSLPEANLETTLDML